LNWTDKVSNEVLHGINEVELCLYNSIQKQKLAFAGHVLRGSSGQSALQILESKLNAKVARVHAAIPTAAVPTTAVPTAKGRHLAKTTNKYYN